MLELSRGGKPCRAPIANRSHLGRALSAVLLLASLPCSAAEPRWIRLNSANFEIYTSASAGSARETLRQFEQVRSFFLQVLGHPPAHPTPVRVVVFGSAKEYDTVRLNEFAAAYYQPTADRDFIVMGPNSAGTFSTAIHEYVHLVVRHSNLSLPPWLNEGLAELYSTLTQNGGKVIVGGLIPGRHAALLDMKWVPLAAIVTADHNSPFYNEKNKAGSLYNEGWALTHMLELREDYRGKFRDFLTAVASGTESVEAFRSVYGKSIAEVDRDLQAYLRGDRFQGMVFSVKLEKFNEQLPAEPLPAFDVKLTLAQIVNRPGREPEVRSRLQELVTEDPKRPEPHAELGYLEWRAARNDAARAQFQEAYARGERGARFLWDYGRLSEREPENAIPILKQLVALEPERLEARLELAETHVRARQAAAALDVLQPVRKVSKSEAPRFFRVSALANWEAGNRDLARSAAEQLKLNALTDAERAEAERILESLAPRREAAAQSDRPIVRRSPVAEPPAGPADPPRPPSPSLSVTGAFEQLDCGGKQAKFIIRTTGGRKTLLIEDPTRISVVSEGGGTVDLSCGRQTKAVPVEVEYDSPSSPSNGVDGVVRVIHFQP